MRFIHEVQMHASEQAVSSQQERPAASVPVPTTTGTVITAGMQGNLIWHVRPAMHPVI